MTDWHYYFNAHFFGVQNQYISIGPRAKDVLFRTIFILDLELLVCAIRTQKETTGIAISNYEFEASLLTFVILLTITQPKYSIPHVHKQIDKSAQFSGYKISYDKSEAIPLNQSAFLSHLGTANFK